MGISEIDIRYYFPLDRGFKAIQVTLEVFILTA